MKGWKNNNDPWKPLPVDDKSNSLPQDSPLDPKLNIPLPQDPLHNVIDSEQYIRTLEKKLERLKKKKDNPSSKDIIDSLALVQSDQMRNLINSDSLLQQSMDGTDTTNLTLTPSYMKRRLFPEMQAINASELAELVKEDFVEKEFDELIDEDQPNGEKENTTRECIENNEKSVVECDDSVHKTEQLNERDNELQ